MTETTHDALLRQTETAQELLGYFQGQRSAMETTIIARKAEVDHFLTTAAADLQQWKQDARPEMRHVQDITIGGTTSYLYPVWWRFPDNGHGISRLQILRHYNWNNGVLNTTGEHQAGLLLAMEGAGYPHNGDANYLRVRKYAKSFQTTVSHLQFGMWAQPRHVAGANTAQPLQFPTLNTSCWNSGLYLRGGGLTYRFVSNWWFTPTRLPDENAPNSEAIVFTIGNTESVVKRIAMTKADGSSNLVEPIEDLIP